MRYISITLGCILITIYSCQNAEHEGQGTDGELVKEISFYTSDNIKILGDLYELDKKAPIILLFHQGGSNARAEYGAIIPQLVEKGFNILAIDQRMGGQIYGNYNRTLANISNHSFDNPYGYCDAYNNLEGALNFVIDLGFTGNKIVWGSSYSASLAIQLANQYQESISGVLAFSPASGRPMADCRPEQYFETLKVPLLVLRPPGEMKNENTKIQLELAKENGHQTYIAKYGVHGSSMLVQERVGNDVSETWGVVTSFLNEVSN